MLPDWSQDGITGYSKKTMMPQQRASALADDEIQPCHKVSRVRSDKKSAVFTNTPSSRCDSMTAPTYSRQKIQQSVPHVALVILIGIWRGESRRASRGRRGVWSLVSCKSEQDEVSWCRYSHLIAGRFHARGRWKKSCSALCSSRWPIASRTCEIVLIEIAA